RGQMRVDGRAVGESVHAHLPTLRDCFEIRACFIAPVLCGAGDAVFPLLPRTEGSGAPRGAGTERRARGPSRDRAGLPCEGDHPADNAGRRASRRSTAAGLWQKFMSEIKVKLLLRLKSVSNRGTIR